MPKAPTPTRRSNIQSLIAQTLIWLLVAAPAWSNPSGGNVVTGQAEISSSGSQTTINASDGSIIEWNDFDIPSGSSVRFIQPHVNARTLQRVLSADPTRIDGNLSANGQLYIVNPYGVFFGDTAIVDVGRLVAGAGDLSNADFLAGVDRFSELRGPVINQGTIHASAVALIGASAANHGRIQTPDGAIWLLAGDQVTIAEHGSPVIVQLAVPAEATADQYAVENTGILDARRGSVRMAAGDLLSLAVRNTGTIRANDIKLAGGEMGRVQVEGDLDASSGRSAGGEIEIRGDLVSLSGATLDASGKTGGGTIHVGGGWQGERASDERNARLTVVDEATVLRADARERGDGGEIAIWSDRNARIQGSLSARGGRKGGDGGRIETSAKHVLDVRVTPDVSAPSGQAGTWLLDPSNIRIVESVPVDITPPNRDLSDEFLDIAAAPLAEGDPAVLPVADDSEVAASAIENALGRGFSVILSTQNIGSGGNQDGDITFAAPLDFSDIDTIRPATRATLTLRAANDIRTEPGISIDDTSPNDNLALSVDFLAGDDSQPANPTAPEGSLTGAIEIQGDIRVGGGIELVGDRVDITGNLSAGDAIVDPEAPDPDTSGTTILVQARQGGMRIGSSSSPVTITTGSDQVTGGAILLRTSANEGGTPNNLTANADIATNGGSLVVVAEGGDLAFEGGIDTTTGTPDAFGLSAGGIVLVDANLLVTNGESNPDRAEVAGGNVTLAGSGIRAGGGGIAVTAQSSLEITAPLETSDQAVAIGLEDISSIVTTPPTPRTVSVTGGITSNGGGVQLVAAGTDGATIEIGGTIDATDPRPPALAEDDSSVLAVGPAAIDVLTGAELRAEDVQVAAGTAGTGDLTFGAATRIEARSVALQAGNGYTDPIDRPAPEDLARIDYGGLEIGSETGSTLESLSLRQDGAVGGTDGTVIPGTARVRFRNALLPDPLITTEMTIAAHDSTLELSEGGASARALLSGRDRVELEAATNLVLGTASDGPIGVSDLDIKIYENQTIDTVFANNASGLDQLSVTTGIGARGASGSAEAIDGSLQIEDNVALEATDTLTLQAGASGVGDLIIGDPEGAAPGAVSFRSDRITLRAGSGLGNSSGSSEGLARVDFTAETEAVLETADFTLRQDGAIGGASGTTIPQVTLPSGGMGEDGLRLALRSDDDSVTLDEAARPILEDTHLSVIGATIDASAFSQDNATSIAPLQVRSLELGRTGSFTVDESLLRSFAFTQTAIDNQTSEIVLRAGLVRENSRLSFSEGTLVEGDTIRLIASDGPGGNALSAVSASRATFRRPLQGGETPEAPRAFVLEQDARITDNTLPTAVQFADQSGAILPMEFGLRSADSSIDLNNPLAVPVAPDAAALQVFGGRAVSFTTNGDLSFTREGGTPRTEFRSEEVQLTANNNAGTAAILLSDADVTFAGHDVADDGADAGDFLPFSSTPGGDPQAPALIGPALVILDQDATIDASTLPLATFIGEPAVYELRSQEGSIDLADASRVEGTALVLRLPGVSDTDTLDPENLRRFVLGGALPYELAALDIRHNRAVLLAGTDGAGIDIRSTGLVDIAGATAGQTDENLAFAAGSSIEASSLLLQAGNNNFDPLADPAVPVNGVVELNGLRIDLTSDPEAFLSIVQDGSLGRQNGSDPVDTAFDYTLVTDDGTPTGVGVDVLSLRSRRGDLGVDVTDIQNARTVSLSAGGLLTDQRSRVTLRAESGDLALDDPSVLPHLSALNLTGDEVRLVSEGPDTRVLANSDKLTLFGASFATPTSLTLEQTAPFSNADLVGSERFDAPGLLGLPYTLRSPGHGFVVDTTMADQLSVFDVTLDSSTETGPTGTTTLDASLAEAQAFAGLEVIADDIRIETSLFETLAAQTYRGDTVLASQNFDPDTGVAETKLTSLTDILFLGDLDGETADSQSLTMIGGRDMQFEGDVGGTNRLHDLEIDFAGTAARVEFGSAERVDTAVRLAGDLLIRSIDPIAFRADGTITPIARAPATDRFSDPLSASIFSLSNLGVTQADLDAAVEEAIEEGFDGTIEELTAIVLEELVTEFFTVPVSNEVIQTNELFRLTSQPFVATILKQSDNTLDVDVGGDILVGQGEKWTAAGTLDVNTGGALQVGDLTAQVIRLQADGLTLLRRPQSNLIDNQLRTEADAGVDWIANEFDLTFTNGYAIGGTGRKPVVGTPTGAPISATIGGEEVTLPFSSAAIYPDQRNLEARDLIYDRGAVVTAALAPLFAARGLDTPTFFGPTLVLDSRPRGPAAADFSRVLTTPVPPPNTTAPIDTAPVDLDNFIDIGIVARPPTPKEIEGREHAAAILDDASHAWPVDPTIAFVASPRLEEHAAALATDLFDDIFGPAMEHVTTIRETLSAAVDAYREHTGARRVLGFELRRFLRNRPSSQFAAHQLIDRLDQLFSQHRASGLVPGEYVPVQQAWVDQITPDGISPDELAQAIHPSRYVRGSDVLDVFGQ
jgi:filamentous hemagglutinin family protein